MEVLGFFFSNLTLCALEEAIKLAGSQECVLFRIPNPVLLLSMIANIVIRLLFSLLLNHLV